MRRRIIISILGGLLLFGVCAYFSRPLIVLTDDTPLWRSEYDASRQKTLFPGTGTPLSNMKAGDRLRVLWVTDGKDYRAYFVIAPHRQRGWVLFGQHGVTPPAPSLEPTATSRCDERLVGYIDCARRFGRAAAGLWLTSIR
jgi:hypothetical protein